MEFLSIERHLSKINGKIGEALKTVTQAFPTQQQAVKAIREYLLDPSGSEIASILEGLGVDDSSFQEFLRQNETALTALLGQVGDLAEHDLKWGLTKEGEIGEDSWSIDGKADFKAEIDVEVKGEEEEDSSVDELGVTLEDQQALLSIGAQGEVSVGADAAAEANAAGGKVTGKLAFGAGGKVLLENCFLHQRSESALSALAEDFGDFQLPFNVVGADDLRHRSTPDKVVPLQWVHLKASGDVNFGASLAWGGSWVNTGTVSSNSLKFGETITVTTGASASVSVSHVVTGDFDLVLSASPDRPGLVRASLKKSRSSNRQTGFSLTAGVGVQGLDKVGQEILESIQPTLDTIVKKVEDAADFPNLKTLLTDAVGKEVDELLSQTTVDNEITDFLTRFGQDVDIAAELKKLVERKVLDVTSSDIDDVQQQIDKVRAALKDAIKKYRDTIARLNAGLKKAANLKITASYSRSWQKVTAHEAALVVDLDPSLHSEAYRDLIRGNFALAIELFQDKAEGIHIDGRLKESGSFTVTNQVSLDIFGITLGSTSLLTQDWDLEVSPAGDLLLAVKSTFKKTSKIWRQSKTFSFMVDGRVVDTLVGGVVAGNQIFSPTAMLELAREDMPAKDGKIEKFQDEIISLGVATPPLDIQADVALPDVKDKKNRLSTSIVLDLEKRHLDAFLDRGVDAAAKTYATTIMELVLASHNELQTTDAAGNPFLLWQSVQSSLPTQNEGISSKTYTSGDGSATVTVTKGKLPIVRLAVLEVGQFRTFFNKLRDVQVNVQGKTPAQARDMVKAAQKDLVESVKRLSAEHTYNLALFRTVFELANSAGDLDPVAVVTRTKDDKAFTYG